MQQRAGDLQWLAEVYLATLPGIACTQEQGDISIRHGRTLRLSEHLTELTAPAQSHTQMVSYAQGVQPTTDLFVQPESRIAKRPMQAQCARLVIDACVDDHNWHNNALPVTGCQSSSESARPSRILNGPAESSGLSTACCLCHVIIDVLNCLSQSHACHAIQCLCGKQAQFEDAAQR